MTVQRRDKHVHMIWHNHPGVESVTVAVEEQKRAFDEFGDCWLT